MRSRLAVLATLVLATVACVDTGPSGSDDDDGAVDGGSELAPVVTEPLSPFCEGIVELRSELAVNADADDPVDEGELILDRYRELLPVAPDEIADDLAAVIAGADGQDEQLDLPDASGAGDGPAATADAETNEGFGPLATPAGRVATYIETVCAGVSSNPGPAATPPP